MTYATLMVNLEAGGSNGCLLQVAADLAERCRGGIVGITACKPMPILYASYSIGSLIEEDQASILEDVRQAEAEFRRVIGSRVEILGWRSSVGLPELADVVAQQARCADLVLTAGLGDSSRDATRQVDLGALVMQAGRPVLVVPANMTSLQLDRVLLCSKDTPESRRAACDALPLLKLAGHVSVVEIASRDGLPAADVRVRDVANWLGRHGIKADSRCVPSHDDDAEVIRSLAEEQEAGLIVAGAYGHTRLREWAFGGVTRDMLLRGSCCTLVSH